MNKLAIFVEGQTEQIFAERLIRYSGREKNIGIQVQCLSGGRKGSARTVTEITGTSEITHQDYFILIFDCGNDSRVKSGYPLKAGHYVPQWFQALEAAASSDGHSRRF